MTTENRKDTAMQHTSTRATSSSPAADDREIVITRIMNAPRALVFAAWTEPAHVANWFGPRSGTMPVCTLDVRPGGAWFIGNRGPDGTEYPFKGFYREVVAPERLVYTDEWEVEGLPTQEALVTVTFEEQGGKTLLTIRTRFESAAIRDGAAQQGFVAGWGEFLDRLEELLAKA